MVSDTNSTIREDQPPRSRGFWKLAWQQFRQRKLAMIALSYVVLLCVSALLAPFIAGTKPIVCMYKGKIHTPFLSYYNRGWESAVFRKDRFRNAYPKKLYENDPNSWAVWPLVYQDAYRRVQAKEWRTKDESTGEWRDIPGWEGRPGNPIGVKGKPSRYNLLGTDQQGFDVFAQVVYGTQIALSVGLISMGIAGTIGITIGALAGYLGGWVDILLSRLIELVMCVPTLVLILALVALIDEVNYFHIMAIVGCTRWTGIARLARAEFLKLKQMEFVTAARSLGASSWRIMFRHVLRNALAPILVPITFGVADAILIESGLSYLGFSAAPPNPSWGTLLQSGRKAIEEMWWLIFFPGTAIFLTVLAYNLIGEGLQEATDPRLRQDAH